MFAKKFARQSRDHIREILARYSHIEIAHNEIANIFHPDFRDVHDCRAKVVQQSHGEYARK